MPLQNYLKAFYMKRSRQQRVGGKRKQPLHNDTGCAIRWGILMLPHKPLDIRPKETLGPGDA